MNTDSHGSLELAQQILGNLAREYVVLITGQTAAGKDTLADNLVAACPVECRPKGFIDTGRLFRENRSRFSPDAQARLSEINDSGRLQFPGIASSLVTNAVLSRWDKDKLLVICGSPRSEREARDLYAFITMFLKKKVFLVHLTIDDDLAIERILHRNEEEKLAGGPQRTDTLDPQAIRNKLAYHREHVVPAVEEMDRQDKVRITQIHVTRGMSPDSVFERMLRRAPIFEKAH